MTGFLTAVRSSIPGPCIATEINKEGCNVELARASQTKERLIIDFDQPSSHWSQSETRCDYLFLEDLPNAPSRVCPIELKRGGFSVSVVRSQLQAGVGIAERLIPLGIDVVLLPVLASGKVPKSEDKALKRATVRFRGNPKPINIVRIRCGARLP